MITVTQGQKLDNHDNMVILQSGTYEGTDLIPIGYITDLDNPILKLQAYVIEQLLVV